MADDLIQFWRRYRFRPGELAVHPDDRTWMEQNWPAPLREPYLDWQQYLASDRFGSKDSEVHLSHLPAPFWGDLRRARVLLFLKNPGFDNTDYFLESQPDFRKAHLRALRSPDTPGEFPFVHLDPRFSWSGSFLWFEQRLRPVIDALMEDGLSYRQALRTLSQQIAAVQLFPYRSRDSSRLRYRLRGSVMPSVAAAQRFLAERSHAREQLVLVMRSHAEWQTDACATADGHTVLHGPRLQGISLHPRFPAGRRLLEVVREGLRVDGI